MLTKEEKLFLAKLVQPPQFPTTLGYLKQKMDEILGEKDRKESIRRCLKQELGYSYKRGGAFSQRIMDPKLKYLKSIFSSTVLSSLYSGDYIINVDETSFSRSVKISYSWLPRGKDSGIVQPLHQGRSSVIMAVVFDGAWMAMIVRGTCNKEHFKIFLKALVGECRKRQDIGASNIVITLDNASIHTCGLVKNAFKELGVTGVYLPPY